MYHIYYCLFQLRFPDLGDFIVTQPNKRLVTHFIYHKNQSRQAKQKKQQRVQVSEWDRHHGHNQWQCLTTGTWSKQSRNLSFRLLKCWPKESRESRRLMLGVSICGWFVLCFNMRKTNGSKEHLSPWKRAKESYPKMCEHTFRKVAWISYHENLSILYDAMCMWCVCVLPLKMGAIRWFSINRAWSTW